MAFGSVSACTTSSLRPLLFGVSAGAITALSPSFAHSSSRRSGLRRRTQTSRQPDLAEHGQTFTCRYTLRGGGDRQRDGEVGARLVDPNAAGDVDEDVRAAERDAGVPPRHGDDHREPLRVDAGRDAARHRQIGRRDERLDLEQDRPRPLERARDGRADLAAWPCGRTAPTDRERRRGPAPVISKTPSSFVEPKRFLTARRTRCAW